MLLIKNPVTCVYVQSPITVGSEVHMFDKRSGMKINELIVKETAWIDNGKRNHRVTLRSLLWPEETAELVFVRDQPDGDMGSWKYFDKDLWENEQELFIDPQEPDFELRPII